MERFIIVTHALRVFQVNSLFPVLLLTENLPSPQEKKQPSAKKTNLNEKLNSKQNFFPLNWKAKNLSSLGRETKN